MPAPLHRLRGDAGLGGQAVVPQPAADDPDRARDGHRRGQDARAVHADPVAAAGRDIALADHDRLASGLQRAHGVGHQVAGQRVAARRVGAQHDRLDRGVPGQLAQPGAAAAPLDAAVHRAVADQEDHRDAGDGAPRLVPVLAPQRGGPASRPRARLAQRVQHLVPAAQLVDQAGGQRLGRRKEPEAVHHGVDRGGGAAPPGGDSVAPRLVRDVDDALPLLAVGLAHRVAAEHLDGALVREVAVLLEAQPQLVQRALEEAARERQARQRQVALRVQHKAVGDRGQVQRGQAGAVDVDHDPLARVAHRLQLLPHLPQERRPAAEAGQVQRQDVQLRVVAHGLQRVEQVQPGDAVVVQPAVLLVRQRALLQVQGHVGVAAPQQRRRVATGERRRGAGQPRGHDLVAVGVEERLRGDVPGAAAEADQHGHVGVVAVGALARAHAQVQAAQGAQFQPGAPQPAAEVHAVVDGEVAEQRQPRGADRAQAQVEDVLRGVGFQALRAAGAPAEPAGGTADQPQDQRAVAQLARRRAAGPAVGQAQRARARAAGQAHLPVVDRGAAALPVDQRAVEPEVHGAPGGEPEAVEREVAVAVVDPQVGAGAIGQREGARIEQPADRAGRDRRRLRQEPAAGVVVQQRQRAGHRRRGDRQRQRGGDRGDRGQVPGTGCQRHDRAHHRVLQVSVGEITPARSRGAGPAPPGRGRHRTSGSRRPARPASRRASAARSG